GAVKIGESSGTTLRGVSTANSLVLSSGGALTNDATADLAVTGNAALSGTSIDLNTTTPAVAANFGTLTFNSAGAVKIGESSGTKIGRASCRERLGLSRGGALTNDETGDVAGAGKGERSVTSSALG